jgi:sphingomyelin phosphodiesterase acid-like 3
MSFAAPKLRTLAALSLTLLMICGAAHAQSAPVHALPQALMISDIHFDPFHDPAKVSQLAAAPVSGWEAILASPDSPTREKDFAALETTCKTATVNTPYSLLASALSAIRKDAADARFVTMSGDWLTHQYNCRFTTTMPSADHAQFEAFMEKAMEFEAREIEKTLPHVPVYFAMGNNDSNCDDYKLDTNTAYLRAVGKIVGRGAGSAWTAAAAKSFATGGYYSVTMAAPMQRTRLIVVNDIFLASTYKSCADTVNEDPGAAQMRWLAAQLEAARQQHQRVWVMGHIPPGVNPYATAKKSPLKICAPAGTDGAGPAMFMVNESLGDTLVKNAGIIKLAIFGHTHSDEMRLLGSGESEVAAKLVPSITPVYGNNPAFLVAKVDPATATMTDYTMFAAPDAAGSSWAKEYTFSETYGHTGFTPATLRAVMAGFRADPGMQTPASQAYLRFYASKPLPVQMPPVFWQAAVCGMTHEQAADFSSCICGGR